MFKLCRFILNSNFIKLSIKHKKKCYLNEICIIANIIFKDHVLTIFPACFKRNPPEKISPLIRGFLISL